MGKEIAEEAGKQVGIRPWY